MPLSTHDMSHLVSLIEAARLEAERLGTASVARQLDAAARSARALLAGDGKADEGIRPENLTTENDE